MSLLDFFPAQRRQWPLRATAPSADFLAGGLAALALAEADFRATPLLNARQLAEATQQELEDVSYQLSQARAKIKQLEDKLLQSTQPELPLSPSQEKNARRRLRWVLQLARSRHLSPERKVEAIQELAAKYLAAVAAAAPPRTSPTTSPPAVPLPE